MKNIRIEGGGQSPRKKVKTEAEKLEEMNYQYMCAKRDGKEYKIPKGYHLNKFGVIVPVKKQGAKSQPVAMTQQEANWQKEMRNDGKIIGSIIPRNY